MQCTVVAGALQSCHSLGSGEAADQYYVPVNKTWRLNERMYGGLTGSEWRLVNHVRYRGGTTCQMDNFCTAFIVFNCLGWITKGKIMQCPSLPVPSADAARVGQEGDSRRPQLWTPPNCVQFIFYQFLSYILLLYLLVWDSEKLHLKVINLFGQVFVTVGTFLVCLAAKVKKHGADQVCVLS